MKKEEKTKNKEVKQEKKEPKRAKKSKKKLVIVLVIIFAIIFLASLSYLIYYFVTTGKAKGEIKEVQEYMSITEEVTDEQVEKLRNMQNENEDIKAWIKIEDTKINYPVLQGDDNEYYLDHNYKHEKSKYGSIFLKDKSVIDEEMFAGLMKYTDKDYYENHKTITFVTDKEVREYEILAAFKSRVFYKKEKNVFRYYDGINFENEEEFNDYVENVKKIQLYDTGITANYGEQLLTMITCEYSQENGRMVVVAKRVK